MLAPAYSMACAEAVCLPLVQVTLNIFIGLMGILLAGFLA